MTPEQLQRIKSNYGILGSSMALDGAIGAAARVAETDITVLIHGENGSGKESFSKIIHSLSRRKHKSFFAINCGGIPSGTINSELFGHEKGAFTGAVGERRGYFEEANGGTLFMDEIGDMPLDTQAMLLRVLEYGEYIRVGSSEVRKTDVRVIAATNVNLQEAVGQKKFREDLYYRLNSYSITVPPLRERGDDVLLLFRKFARDFGDQYATPGIELSPDAAQLLKAYSFPGNVRELRNIVNQLSVDAEERWITAEKLKPYLKGVTPGAYLPTPLSAFGNNYNNNTNMSDRELLWGVLYDMKKEIVELKGNLSQILAGKTDGFMPTSRETAYVPMTNSNTLPFERIEMPSADFAGMKPLDGISQDSANFRAHGQVLPVMPVESNDYISEITDIEHHEEQEVLSLIRKEKEMIEKALRKHNNRRKVAAEELGISERTLYRKIKEYDINL